YNPFSLLNTLKNRKFRNYWFETGTPTFLVEVLQKNDYALNDLTSEKVSGEDLMGLDTAMRNPVPLIYQSGYLTIKDYDERFGMYRLGYPNKEVDEGFANFLIPYYTPIRKSESRFFVGSFVKDLESGNVKGFMTRLQAIFADGSYTVQGDRELYFQNCMAVILKMLGFYVEVERTTSNGRIDVTIQTRDYVYIMELKRNGTANEAIHQIREKRYADAFLADSRKLYVIGIAFSSDSRRLEEWKVEDFVWQP
ncbi:MAG: PD-(D/E)XK nuclease domain-containing protein, partial [Prevotella sp.]|nr:PD-(D/E)XK nuclease domain-containing protein [Prevotella sp.]